MRKTAFIGMVLLVSMAAWGVPATHQPIVRTLADGSRDTIYLYGDEFSSFSTDTKGRVLTRFGMPQKAPQQKMLTSYFPSQGHARVPVILVNFSDYSFTIDNPIEKFDDLFNGNGGSNPKATGSVHDYYIASSDSALDLQYEVFGVYTLSQPMEYYGANKTNSSGTVISHNIRASELVIEAVRLAVDNGVDLSVYDNDNDGTVDNISIVVAGYNEAEGGEERTIWPHYHTINSSERFGGKYICGYLMISEYCSSGGKNQAGIGTYCHEFGHVLGLPDLYDVENGNNYTVGTWDIMCSGSYNNYGCTPPTYTAFERFVMGWMQPVQVTSGLHTLAPIETDNTALLIAIKPHNMLALNPNPSEYFLLENRQETGWDAGKDALVASGLLVSHITFNKNDWEWNTVNTSHPLGVAIVSAGMSNPTKSTAADVFPGTTKRTSWLPTLNDGTILTHLNVSQIRQRNDGYISLRVGSDGKYKLSFDQEDVSLETMYLYSPVQYDTAHVILLVDSLNQGSIRLFTSSSLFQVSADNGNSWHSEDTLSIPVIPDSTYSIPLLVTYHPTRKSCYYTYAFLTAETEDENEAAQLTLAGRAPRPTYITTPVIDSVTNVSTNSFCIYWTPQEDAEEYYYTLYTLDKGESEETDSINVTFTATGQTAQTARTIYAPDQISMWIDNTYTPNGVDSEVGGQVLISGSADGYNWEKVTTIHVQRTTKNIIRTIELDTAHQWKQFRLEYTHTGGAGGTIIKDWKSHFPMQITYIFPLYEYMLYASGNEVIFRDLTPNTTYYYAMMAFEEKGCEPHYSALSTPVAITTNAVPETPRLTVRRDAEGHYTVELPEMADGLHTLGIYDYMGRMVYLLHPAYGETVIDLPQLPHGQVYTIKYFHNRIKRKDLNTKLLSY